MTKTGAALIALAIYFNIPFALLAANFDYPDILRQPADVILTKFQAGGVGLIATWYAFAVAALLLVPVGLSHAFAKGRMARTPELATSAAVLGVLAGLLQAMGLLRWVLVVPDIAASGDVQGFALIHAYGGLALGEHLGMLLTAGHVGILATMQRKEQHLYLAISGHAVCGLIALGALEGPALALGLSGWVLAQCAVAGYLGLSLWMIVSGLNLGLRFTRP